MIQDHAASQATSRHATRFLACTMISALTCLSAVYLLVSMTLLAGREKLPHQALLELQRAKLDGDLGEVIFVGDSSLGNAVDVRTWSSLSGRTATNLALTGIYGFDGSLAMLRAVLARKQPTDVVIMQAAGMTTRTSEVLPPRLTKFRNGLDALATAFLETMNLPQIRSSIRWLHAWLLGDLGTTGVIDNDYVRQSGRASDLPGRVGDPEQVRLRNAVPLGRIADLCNRYRMNCIYVHGPISAPACDASVPFFAAANQLIASSGLKVVGEHSVCLYGDEVGDSPNHAAPAAKAAITGRIHQLVAPHLSSKRQKADRQ